ncbi:MAG: glycosyltransferase family 2 protein [Chloroflexota bacterium]|nr:glycosyltransferase family 2 protein [Chloroflexota bacterium]
MRALAVIIVSWNVRELLERCLAALQADLAQTEAQAQVWVVDNASNDNSETLVREKHPWVHLETPGENLGFVRGNNLILNRLRAGTLTPPDYVWLLNPDTEVQPGATQALLDFFAAHPRAGLAGPQLLNPDGTLQQSAFRFPGLLQPLFDLGLLPARFYQSRWNGRYSSRSHYAKGRPFRVDHPLGAALMARGDALAQVGPLDERFFMYCEEIDWAWRMRKAGWQSWLAPAAEVLHHGGASTGQARPQTMAYLWESRARLYRKHRGALTRALVGAAVRRHFSRARHAATSHEWEAAYRRIVKAW